MAEAILQVATAVFAEIRGLQDIQLLPDNTDLTPTGVPEAIRSLPEAALKDHQVIRRDLTVVLLPADLHIAEVPIQEVLTLQVLHQAPHQAEGHRQVAAAVQEGDNLNQYNSVFKVHSK
jgi:hypothetical protein